jgi:predicted  nucleic acid-binding Zn-ribbon protein
MKKIFLVVMLGMILSASSAYAVGSLAQERATALTQREANIASRGAKITQAQANISQDLKQRAEKEITRRLDFLNDLITKLNGIKKLSSAEKADLQGQIQTQIDGLNALQTKINADTDNTTLRADVKSIIGNYYIFLFFRVKVNLLIAADRTSATSDNLKGIYTKLQTRINQAQTSGVDVTLLNPILSDMNAKITDANTQITAAQTELTPLTAQGYPGNKLTLEDARSKIKTAVTDLKAAYKDAIQIRNDLGGIKIKNPEASTSAH